MSEKLIWKYEKFKGDMGVYAICPVCNFAHGVGEKNFSTGELEIRISEEYIFCPMCGTFLYDTRDKVYACVCVMNVRDTDDLYQMKLNTDVIVKKINEQMDSAMVKIKEK